MSVEQNNAYLMQALNFTPQELMMNRSGVMSEAQKARLQAKYGQQRQAAMKIFAIVMVLTVVIFAGIVATNAQLRGSLEDVFATSPAILAVPAVILVLWMLMIIVSLVRSGRTDYTNRRLMAVEGVPKLKSSDYTYSTAGAVMSAAGQDTYAYTVQMGKLTFYVDGEAFNGFVQGRPYRLYYLPNGRVPLLVSAEALLP